MLLADRVRRGRPQALAGREKLDVPAAAEFQKHELGPAIPRRRVIDLLGDERVAAPARAAPGFGDLEGGVPEANARDRMEIDLPGARLVKRPARGWLRCRLGNACPAARTTRARRRGGRMFRFRPCFARACTNACAAPGPSAPALADNPGQTRSSGYRERQSVTGTGDARLVAVFATRTGPLRRPTKTSSMIAMAREGMYANDA